MQSNFLSSKDQGHHSSGNKLVNVSDKERIASVALGAFLIMRGLKKFSFIRAALGGYLVYRGATGYCAASQAWDRSKYTDKASSVNIQTTLIVNKPKQEVYDFWRKLENLPLFMKHLKSVREVDGIRSHWEANVLGNLTTINWDAEIVKEEDGHLISWKSLPGATVENAGKVDFSDALGNQGTELRVVITYKPPAGKIGGGLAWLLNPVFKRLIENDINNFKQYIETGFLPALETENTENGKFAKG